MEGDGSDAPPPETPPEPETPRPAEEDWASRFKYLLADFENYRKRVDRERDQARRVARTEVLRILLPIWESSERAREAAKRLPARDPLRAGLDLLATEWERFFERQRVEPVARVGEPFRSDEHEAVGEVPATEKTPDGAVAEVVQQGYRSEDGLVRAAKVVVARRPIESPEPSEAPAPGAPAHP